MTKENPKTELEARIKEFKGRWRPSRLDLSGLSLKTQHLEAARSAFTGLDNVKSLYLGANIASRAKLRSTNSLTDVPEWLFGSVPNLEILDLSDNELQSLPDTISTCIRLHTLKLSGNAFAQFPITACAIPTLRNLNLEGPGNTFGSLPEDIRDLRALVDLRVNKTAVKWPPLDIIEQGAERTIGFVRDVVINGGQVINEAKVILVGPGDHGKTTLRLWLTESRFVERASTRGGEIGELRVQATRADTGKSGRIRLWDFGGQEQYRAAQRSLFSADALFVLVCKARGKIEEAGVPEWLQLIEHVNRQATVFLVFSHMDHVDRAPTLEHLPPRLRALIPNDNIFELDATRPDGGIETIRQRIVETCRKMDAFGHRWPVSELRLRVAVDDLRQKGLKVISKDHFRLLCEQHGVESDRVDGVAQSIGNIAVGPDAKIVVIDPEWILKAISYLHDDKAVRERNGVLLRSDLDRIWINHKRKDTQKPLQFSEQYWDDILAVMTHQGLAYRLGDSEWLVPECVTGTRPDNIDWTADSDAGPRRTIQLEAPIYGIAQLMTAALHPYHIAKNRNFWSTGGFFRDQNGGELHIQTESNVVLRMEERGRDAPLFLDMATSALRGVTNRYWPETAVAQDPPFHQHVPCTSKGCDGYHVLQAIKRTRNKLSQCSTGSHAVAIAKLIYGHAVDVDEGTIKPADLRDIIRDALDDAGSKADLPRIIRVTDASSALKNCRILRLVCELTLRDVEASELELADDTTLAKSFKILGRQFVKAAAGASVGEMGNAVDAVVDGAEDLMGVISERDSNPALAMTVGLYERRRHEAVDPFVAGLLEKMAAKAHMRQVLDRETNKWLWASAEAANRHDPNIAKE